MKGDKAGSHTQTGLSAVGLAKAEGEPHAACLCLCAATMPCNTFHLSPFTFHQSQCRTEPRPASLPYALAADNFCTSSLVSFTSAKRNKGLSCSGVRALAIGATTAG